MMGIAQILIIVLAVCILAAVIIALCRRADIRCAAAFEMGRGIIKHQMVELIRTAERKRTVDAPVRFLGDSLQQYFAVAGVFNRRKAISYLRWLLDRVNLKDGHIHLNVHVRNSPLSVYPAFEIELDTINPGIKARFFESNKNQIVLAEKLYRS